VERQIDGVEGASVVEWRQHPIKYVPVLSEAVQRDEQALALPALVHRY